MARKNKAYLFGPFFGEAAWEFFRFAPYAIHLKKTEPNTILVVMTRPERFDFYGQYADILVPLEIKNEADVYKQSGFKLLGFPEEHAKRMCDLFVHAYKKKFYIKGIFTPDFSSLRYKLKWQFPRGKMDYDFVPRKKNIRIANNISKKKNIIIVDIGYKYETSKYHVIDINYFKNLISSSINNKNTTYYGCLIHLLKRSKFVIGNLSSDVGRLAILLKTPLIYPYREISDDNVFLMNPLKTPIIDCESIIEGVRMYEDNI
jgi:hypothetical protein